MATDDEAEGMAAQIERRRKALGISGTQLADRAGVHRNTYSKVKRNDPTVERTTLRAILATLDELEHRYGLDKPDTVVQTIELGDGTRVTYTGSPRGVVEAAELFLARRRAHEGETESGE